MPPFMRRPLVVIAIGLVVGIGCGLAYLLLTGSENDTHRPPAASSETSSGADIVIPTEREAARLESAVTSGKPSSIRDAFGIPPDQELESTFTATVKKWRALDIDLESFVATGADAGTAEAQLTSTQGSVSRWSLTLQRRPEGGWFIVTTEEVVG